MKRKLISFAIVLAVLLQTTVFAGILTTNILTQNGGAPQTKSAIPVDTGIYVSPTGSSSYSTSTTAQTFDIKASIAMSSLWTYLDLYYDAGKAVADDYGGTTTASYEGSLVTGQFTITLNHPNPVTQAPAATKPLTVAEFNSQLGAGSIFTISAIDTSDPTKTVITANVKSGVTAKSLKDNKTTYLANFDLDLDQVSVSVPKSTISIYMTGYIVITETDETSPFAKLDFNSDSLTSATVYNLSTGSSSSSGGVKIVTPVTTTPPVITNDGQELDAEVKENADGTYTVTIKNKPEEMSGFVENGWSKTPYAGGDKDYDGVTVIENVVPDEDGNFVLYPRYVNVTIPESITPDTDKNGNYDHDAYIVGYPDGEIKPTNNITREEVASIFYRLLNKDFLASVEATEQDFPDVDSDRWSNDAIATMANGGFIVGDQDGNFNPSNPITRAEFTVIASKFAPATAESAENYFTDINGHWAKDFILKATGQYWISGYEDGSFKPDAYITRAEAMTIINRMLVRYGDIDSSYAKDWPDVKLTDWFYGSVIEATTDNTYERKANGWSETWVEE